MSDDLVKRLRELRSKQYADPNTAPEFVFLDPDFPPKEWEEQYAMDVIYVRADRIEELEKACKEWSEVSQSNYQRAKVAEAKLANASHNATAFGHKIVELEAELDKAWKTCLAATTKGMELEAKLEVAVEALLAFQSFERSAFFGQDADKNKQAVYRGVKRKITKALAAVGVKP